MPLKVAAVKSGVAAGTSATSEAMGAPVPPVEAPVEVPAPAPAPAAAGATVDGPAASGRKKRKPRGISANANTGAHLLVKAASGGKGKRVRYTQAALNESLCDATDMTPKDVKKFLDALRKIAVTTLRDQGIFSIHNLCSFRIKKRPAKAARTRQMFGKTVLIQARSETAKVMATIPKSFVDDVAAVTPGRGSSQ
jgi:nucleoid DNA-binding protein